MQSSCIRNKMNPVKIKRKPFVLAVVSSALILFLLVGVWTRSSSNFSSRSPTIEFVVGDEVDSSNSVNSNNGDGEEDGDSASGSQRNTKNNLWCQHTPLKLSNPDIDKFFFDPPPLECDKNGEDWVRVYRHYAAIKDSAREKFGPIKCHFTELLRKDEYNTVNGATVTIGENEEYTFTDSDYVEAKCTGRGRSEWKSYLAAPRTNLPLPMQKEKSSKALHGPLNVLIWGQDSISRLMFMRKLPVSWKYLQKDLKAVVLKGYNIVGDGTPQALTPILTGKTELELPEARSEMGDKAQFVNVYPWIWDEYKNKGYLTGFLEDQPTTGCFSHRHKGFDATPVDFYMRIYFLAVDSFLYPLLTKVFSYMWPNYCIASTPTHKVMMDYFTSIVQSYDAVPKFLFAFRSEQSHNDVNAIQNVDKDLKEFLETLKETAVLNNSILIVMSDHGARFQAIRESQQGKLEERLPSFMFIFPEWFPLAYPIAFDNFQKNAERLVTPFDIHRTLQDIHKLGDGELKDEDFLVPNEVTVRSASLFRSISPSRTCRDADVEAHWCACLKEETLKVDSELVQTAAQEFVNMVNGLTDPHRSLCSTLKLTKVLSAVRLIPSDELLKFQKSSDRDGRVAKMTGDTEISSTVLQLKVETSPGGGHYEVTMNYDRYKGKFLVKETDISRVNKYGSQADCVAHQNQLSYLRKYCHCLYQPNKEKDDSDIKVENDL